MTAAAAASPLLAMTKPIIAMVHFLPLPGSSGYDTKGGMGRILDGAARDIAALQAAGVDAVMFGNEGDRPYRTRASAAGLTAMAAAIGELKPLLHVPFGVNYLWDPLATVQVAAATGAAFAREIFTGVYASDMGVWAPDAAAALEERTRLGRPDLALLFNINAEFAAPLDTRPIETRARSAVFSSLADIICVSGGMTGEGVEVSELARVKRVLPATPVFANTGVRIDTVAEILKHADGCVVGTHFKQGGDTWAPVDGERAARFMDHVRTLR
jgi:membrane complex biogenesis BtpA family protein